MKEVVGRNWGTEAKEALATHYEELRRKGLDGAEGTGGGLGLALFMHKGTVAWMGAWSHYRRKGEVRSTGASPSHAFVPQDQCSEMVLVLAGMALRKLCEVMG